MSKLSMREKYTAVEKHLKNIDFDAIWKGFVPYEFALYDKTTVYFKDREIVRDDQVFFANTVITFEGQKLAILGMGEAWGMDFFYDNDPELITAECVHEMFHVHQSVHGQYSQTGGDPFVILAYPMDMDNFQLKLIENHFLSKAITDKDAAALGRFVALRTARSRLISGEYFECEIGVETSEGEAEYAGLAALRQINPAKHSAKLQEYMEFIQNPENIMEIRKMGYFTGTLTYLALEALGVDFYPHLADPRNIFEILQDMPNSQIAAVSGVLDERQRMFDDFVANHTEKVDCDTQFAGLDPMNTIKLGDRYLCKHFVSFSNGEFHQGPIMLLMAEDSLRHVTGYLK